MFVPRFSIATILANCCFESGVSPFLPEFIFCFFSAPAISIRTRLLVRESFALSSSSLELLYAPLAYPYNLGTP